MKKYAITAFLVGLFLQIFPFAARATPLCNLLGYDGNKPLTSFLLDSAKSDMDVLDIFQYYGFLEDPNVSRSLEQVLLSRGFELTVSPKSVTRILTMKQDELYSIALDTLSSVKKGTV